LCADSYLTLKYFSIACLEVIEFNDSKKDTIAKSNRAAHFCGGFVKMMLIAPILISIIFYFFSIPTKQLKNDGTFNKRH
jgi:hypothetical protein